MVEVVGGVGLRGEALMEGEEGPPVYVHVSMISIYANKQLYVIYHGHSHTCDRPLGGPAHERGGAGEGGNTFLVSRETGIALLYSVCMYSTV